MSIKQLLGLFPFLAIAIAAEAETFLGITSATNRLVVGTNEALVILRFEVASPRNFQLVKDGGVFTTVADGVPMDRISPASPAALAGPCELILTNQASLVFHRLPTSSLQTLALTPSATTNTAVVSVPSDRSIRVFRPFPTYPNNGLRVSRGTNGVELQQIAYSANEEFAGPVDLTFRGPTSGTESHIFTYALTEDTQVVPQGVAIQSGTGAFQLELEKSTGLTNWSPVVIQHLREDQKAYYRLRITK
jgi:hypothetical protein